ncbi:MAG: hypothetical protein JO157_04670 [Acetobacteraceae bacterium]|nr:hypothetical protein [Acetobacteraceae bacterium]
MQLIGETGRRERFQLPLRTSTTSQVALQQLCEEGMGIAILFYPDVRLALERGELVRLLSGWQLPSHPLTMLTPKSIGEAAKVRVAGAALKSYFAGLQQAS